ncbi:MAG: hypothetical protein FWE50_01240 [Alphaproteobacteria bacterium]|nr:hypothetical protein [Alphaproteobacteria bacterium]
MNHEDTICNGCLNAKIPRFGCGAKLGYSCGYNFRNLSESKLSCTDKKIYLGTSSYCNYGGGHFGNFKNNFPEPCVNCQSNQYSAGPGEDRIDYHDCVHPEVTFFMIEDLKAGRLEICPFQSVK